MTVSTGDGSTKIVGNGVAASGNRETGSFSQIEIDGVFRVFLSQGDKESVKVETDENVLPFILTSVENNVLKVKMKDSTSISKMKRINIYITLVNISKLRTTGVGSLKCSNQLKLRELEFVNQGVGATELNLAAEKLTVKSETIGALVLAGNVKDVSIDNNGVGLIQAFDLKAEKLSLHSDGIGAAEVYASKELNINSSGVGTIKYKGNPQVKNIKNDGIGKIASAE